MAMKLYRSFDLEVYPDKHRIQRDGRELSLRPKSFRVLLLFLAHPGEILSKKYLLEQVWSGTVVEEQTLFQSIKELRQLCGDRSVIRNYPRQGYAWTPEVKVCSVGEGKPAKRAFHRAAVAATALVLVSIVLGLFSQRIDPIASEKGAVLVLPVENRLTDRNHAWLRLGAMDLLVQRLADAIDMPVMHTEDVLDVLARANYPSARSGEALVRRIFDVSGAGTVVKLAITGTPAEYEILYEIHTPDARRRGALFDKSVEAALAQLNNLIARDFERKSQQRQIDYSTAFDSELLAMGLQRLRSGEFKAARNFLQTALAEDPDNLTAMRLLAETHSKLAAPDTAEALLSRALQLSRQSGEFQERPRLHVWLARVALQRGNYETAITHAEAARPAAESGQDWLYRAYANETLGDALLMQGRYSDAETVWLAALQDQKIINCPEGQATVLQKLARAAISEHKDALAAQRIKNALEIASQAGLIYRQFEGWLALASHYLNNGRPGQADAAYVRARELAENDPTLLGTLQTHLDSQML